jgi:hypothetical protein
MGTTTTSFACRKQELWEKEEPAWMHDGFKELTASDDLPPRLVRTLAELKLMECASMQAHV